MILWILSLCAICEYYFASFLKWWNYWSIEKYLFQYRVIECIYRFGPKMTKHLSHEIIFITKKSFWFLICSVNFIWIKLLYFSESLILWENMFNWWLLRKMPINVVLVNHHIFVTTVVLEMWNKIADGLYEFMPC